MENNDSRPALNAEEAPISGFAQAFGSAADFFYLLAEIANIGVLLQVLGTFGIVLHYFVLIPVISDALIYFFRACGNISSNIAEWIDPRIEISGRPLNRHDRHALYDILAILMFLSAVTVIIASIFLSTATLPFIGWALGLAGVTFNWIISHHQIVKDLEQQKKDNVEYTSVPQGIKLKTPPPFKWLSLTSWQPFNRLLVWVVQRSTQPPDFNWLYPSTWQAFNRLGFKMKSNWYVFDNILDNTGNPQHDTDYEKKFGQKNIWLRQTNVISIDQQIKTARHARNMYLGILLLVTLSVLCGTAAPIFPSAALVLVAIAKVSGAALGVLNVGRFINWCAPNLFIAGFKKVSGWCGYTPAPAETSTSTYSTTLGPLIGKDNDLSKSEGVPQGDFRPENNHSRSSFVPDSKESEYADGLVTPPLSPALYSKSL